MINRKIPSVTPYLNLRRPVRYDDLTRSQRARIRQHANQCKICGINYALVIDHCHACGYVRGVICTWCNLIIELTPTSKYDFDALEFLKISQAHFKRINPDRDYITDMYLSSAPENWNPTWEQCREYLKFECTNSEQAT
jgi:hypothetical protein